MTTEFPKIGRKKLLAVGMMVASFMLAIAVIAVILIAPQSESGRNDSWSYPDVTLEEYSAACIPHPQVTTADLIVLVDPEDPHVKEIAAHMNSASDVLTWVSSHIVFGEDIDVYGSAEHWAGPVETLFNHQADCEDSAVLIASILTAMGYVPELVIIAAEPKGHVAVILDGMYIDQFAVHGQPPVNGGLVSSIVGVTMRSDGTIVQRIIDKGEIFI